MNTYVDTALKIESLWSEVLIIDCSKDDLVINDLAFLLGTDCQGGRMRLSMRRALPREYPWIAPRAASLMMLREAPAQFSL